MTDQPAYAPRFFVLILCAGAGNRAGAGVPKQYRELAGQPMVLHTLAAFAAVPRIADLLVVVSPGDQAFEALSSPFSVADCGGDTRAQSVYSGLDRLFELGADRRDWVLVHDAARCLILPSQIEALIDACAHDAVGGLLAHRLTDTLKQQAPNGRVEATLDRSGKWLAQTPQMFRLGALLDALQQAVDHVTDEAAAMEAAGHAPLLVACSAQNFKVTFPEDFALAEAILRSRRRMSAGIRIGEGWDTHALVPGRKLVIGGVQIAHRAGLLGHSDADVLLHAIIDALLGAAALGDIGKHFPDTDRQFAGANSVVLLTETGRRLRAAGFEIGNIDSTIVAQAPRLAAHIPAMRARIAMALDIAVDQVNVKAKTAEKLGSVGQGAAIEARAVSLLFR